MAEVNSTRPGDRRRLILPLVLFLALALLLGVGLTRNPRLVPSPLIGKPMPSFSLPRLHDPSLRLGHDDLRGHVSLLNVWATWCVACRQEHETLIDIARHEGIPIYGLNYKDDRADALRWLSRLGDPYRMTASDQDGRVALDFGVYGAPETYIVDHEGRIAYKHIGPITGEIWRRELAPRVRSLQSRAG